MVKVQAALLGLSAMVAAVACAPSEMQMEKRKPVATPTYQNIAKRQQITTGAFSAFSGTLPASISSVIATITSGTASSFTEPTPKTIYPAGATNTYVSGAPALPSSSPNPANFPALDQKPDPNLALSKQFIASVDMSQIPNIALTNGTCTGSQAANAQQNHWWTCGGWTTTSDVTVCPDKNTWGLSYDDGPSPYTPQLLDYLDQNNLKSTFFIVGSRAISRPDMLRYEYMNGHQLSVHTWSHPYLTTLTNEQIVLELAWTKYVIQQITGVTPLTMRPPYGDIDDRVRAICKQLDLTPIIWTSDGSNADSNYDTNDWRIGAGEVSAASVVGNFTNILNRASNLNTGYIVLEHDLYQQSVELATGVVLPMALAHQPKQKLEPIVQCLGLPLSDAYVETNSNSTGSGGANSPGDSNPSSNSSSSTGSSGTGGSTGNLGTSSGSSGSGGSSGATSAYVPQFATAALGISASVAFFML